jgi:hypothetical protein
MGSDAVTGIRTNFSLFYTGLSLTSICGYVWYLHVNPAGVFVADLPFGGMLNMIMAPVSLALSIVSKHPVYPIDPV